MIVRPLNIKFAFHHISEVLYKGRVARMAQIFSHIVFCNLACAQYDETIFFIQEQPSLRQVSVYGVCFLAESFPLQWISRRSLAQIRRRARALFSQIPQIPSSVTARARARTEIPHNNSNVEAERQVQTPPPDQTTILTEAGGEACYKHTAITTSV